jgi:hypothetical protein
MFWWALVAVVLVLPFLFYGLYRWASQDPVSSASSQRIFSGLGKSREACGVLAVAISSGDSNPNLGSPAASV